MDLKHVRTFVTVAECGTVSGAAARLRLTQPVLSRRLQALQQVFAVRLFDRVGRRLLLTGEGEELLRDCRSLLSHAEAVMERAHSLGEGKAGVLRVGASPQMIESVFPAFLARYGAQCPEVRVQLVEAGAVEHIGLLRRGAVHLAIGLAPNDGDDLAMEPLPPFQVLIAHAHTLNLPGGAAVEIDRLAGLPLLLLDPSFGTRKLFDAACRLARLRVQVFHESGAAHTLVALAEAGLGVAVLPPTLRMDGTALRIATLTYRGEPLEAALSVLWDGRRPLPRYAETFAAAFAAHMYEVFPLSAPR